MLDWLGLNLTLDDAIAYAIIAAFILLPILGILRMILWPRPLVAAAAADTGGGEEGGYERRRSCETGDDDSGSCSDGGGDGGGGGD